MPTIFSKANAAITLGGLTLASIAQTCQGEPQLAVVAGVLGYLASVSSNQAHACYNSFVENQSPGADEVFRNHHLQGLVESAVHSTMLLAVQYSPADKDSEDFQNALATFPKYIANSAQKSDSQLAQLGSFDLPDFLKNFVAQEGKAEFLSAREWEALLDKATPLPSSLRSAVALTLHQKFPEGLWHHVKISAEKDAQAFAALELLYLSRILNAVEGKSNAPDISALKVRTEELYAQLSESQKQWFDRLWAQAERHHKENIAAHEKTQQFQQSQQQKMDEAILPIMPLRQYKANLRTHFRLHENIGLPATSNTDEKNVAIELRELFVEPYCTDEYINADAFDAALQKGDNPAGPILPLLAEKKRLVVLGDPGIGKSTLVQWLIVTLAEEYSTKDTPPELKNCIPLPFILRDLAKFLPEKPEDWTWKSLVDAFSRYKPNKDVFDPLIGPFLTGDKADFHSLLHNPRALFLMDGLDEIGNQERRIAMRNVIWQGFREHPDARWIITSRLIGYESAEVDVERIYVDETTAETGESVPWPFRTTSKISVRSIGQYGKQQEQIVENQLASRLYLAPFDNEQQLRYATNWYVKRLDEVKGKERAKKFVNEVHLHSSTRVIGRVPNLLHLLALLYQHRAKLPNGRFNVYKDISEAYLKSIDDAREVDGGDKAMIHRAVSDKERWLAAIAWQMQRRRTTTEEEDEDANILASRDEILTWGVAELQRGGSAQAETEFACFLDFIGRRSGLLIPRGSEEFGFAHLSFLEYYASVAVSYEHTRLLTPNKRSFAKVGKVAPTPDAVKPEDFARWAADPQWHEVLTFLAERYGASGDENLTEDLIFSLLFPLPEAPVDADEVPDDEKEPLLPLAAARLLASMSLNPHVALSEDARRFIWDSLWAAYLDWPFDPYGFKSEKTWNIAPALLANDEDRHKVLDSLVGQFQDRKKTKLILFNTQVSDVSPLAQLTNLQSLNLMNAQVSDVSPLAQLTKLQELDLDGTQVSDVSPLACLANLQFLDLRNTLVNDVSPLAQLTDLQEFYLANTQVSDVSPLAQLIDLQILDLRNTQVSDLSPLAQLTNLQRLWLSENMRGNVCGVKLLGDKVRWL